MEINYTRNTLVEIDQHLNSLSRNVILTGSDLTIPEIQKAIKKIIGFYQ